MGVALTPPSLECREDLHVPGHDGAHFETGYSRGSAHLARRRGDMPYSRRFRNLLCPNIWRGSRSSGWARAYLVASWVRAPAITAMNDMGEADYLEEGRAIVKEVCPLGEATPLMSSHGASTSWKRRSSHW